jgi:hypothetical protein
MSSRKRLEKLNPVSGKSGDAHFDPNLTVATGRFRAGKRSVPADYSGKFIFFKNAL